MILPFSDILSEHLSRFLFSWRDDSTYHCMGCRCNQVDIYLYKVDF